MKRGRLITIEGLDGAGKSTLAQGLAEAWPDATLLREPGGVALAERLREVVKDASLAVDARAEALVYAAARAQLVAERLGPLLDEGRLVVVDRFVDSSLAYQGAGRGLGVEAVRHLNGFALAGIHPDRTVLLRIDPALRHARIGDRGEAADRLEAEADEFFALVAAAYDELAAEEPERWVVIDAAQAPEAVLAEALRALEA